MKVVFEYPQSFAGRVGSGRDLFAAKCFEPRPAPANGRRCGWAVATRPRAGWKRSYSDTSRYNCIAARVFVLGLETG